MPISAVGATSALERDRSLAVLFGAAAAIGVLAAVLPHPPRQNPRVITALALSGFPLAALLWRRAGRLPVGAFQALLVVGTILVTVACYFAGPGTGMTAGAVFYVALVAYISLLLPWRIALLHVAHVGVAFAVLLRIRHEPGSPAIWLTIMGAALVIGAVVQMLVRRIEALAATDSLTGVPNRRVLDEVLKRELARAQRRSTSLSLMLLDLDDFKRVNDTLGHQEGDVILRDVAMRWATSVRAMDLVARYGGDEFAVVLPETGPEEAETLLGRVRAATPGDSPFSAGVACWNREESAESLVSRADAAVREAKRTGGGEVFAGYGTA